MFPSTPAAEAALAVATRYYSPALFNHCVRSYLWGVTYGATHGVAFDDELYYVAAMLHDIALTEPFGSHRMVFEEAAVAGRRPEEFPPAERAEVLAVYPRLQFGREFLASFEDQAARKPGSSAGILAANNAAARIGANPLGPN
ncbi:cyanamide hydratase [Mycolicibacterium sp. P1-5]|uniref:cyanamide hydratase n=1 Tax=Mycolicibacterium sp. P1-5 TaxID=2024617 RepID=UPI0011EC899F|nr:cyanamide hydratase [Mycolicibacterium sp. P1-5]KAA0101438.1 cyanamide hydratase [Mycolicibacterium sp. P1-5]